MAVFARVVARNSFFGVAAQFAIKALSFAFSILVLRHLGADAFGQYAGILAFGAVFVFLADLGLSPYVVREVARVRHTPSGADRAEGLYGNVLALRFLLSVVTAGVVIGAAVLTGRPAVMVGAIALGTLGLIMYSVQGTSDAILAGHERLDLSSAGKVLNQAAFIAAGTAALWLGFGYYGLVVANLLGVAALTIYCWRAVRRLGIRPRGLAPGTWPAILRASVPFGVIGFALGLSYRFDSVLLAVFRTDAETGYYNAAYNLVFSAAILSNAFNTALFPSLTRKVAISSEGLVGIYERSLRYLLIVALPIAMGLAALADRVVPTLFTDAYAPAIPALRVVIWAVPLMFVSEFLGYVALIQNRESGIARAVVVSTGFNIAVNALLVPQFGFLAAAVMTVVTEAALAGQYLWLLRATVRQLHWGRAVARPLIAVAGMGLAVVLLGPRPLVESVAVGAFVYLGLLILVGALGREEVAFARALVRRAEPAVVGRTQVGGERADALA